jgi:hypothetical protein
VEAVVLVVEVVVVVAVVELLFVLEEVVESFSHPIKETNPTNNRE